MHGWQIDVEQEISFILLKSNTPLYFETRNGVSFAHSCKEKKLIKKHILKQSNEKVYRKLRLGTNGRK